MGDLNQGGRLPSENILLTSLLFSLHDDNANIGDDVNKGIIANDWITTNEGVDVNKGVDVDKRQRPKRRSRGKRWYTCQEEELEEEEL